MNKFCENCGAKLKEGAKFCPNCGTKVNADISNSSNEQSTATESNSNNNVYEHSTVSKSMSHQYDNTQDTSWKGPYNGSGDPRKKAWSRTWVNSFSINQCMGRADFWYGAGTLIAGTWMLGKAMTFTQSQMLYLIEMIIAAFFEIFLVIGAIQRYHDTGHNGWWIFVPIVNIILLFERTNWNSTRWPRHDYSNED